MEVVKKVPHRHFIFSIPKMLRRYFLYDRSLLSDLSRCAWETLKSFYQTVNAAKSSIPGAVIAIQTFGDFLGFNPHCHVLVTDGSFYDTGAFKEKRGKARKRGGKEGQSPICLRRFCIYDRKNPCHE
jgi:hypothetical protein